MKNILLIVPDSLKRPFGGMGVLVNGLLPYIKEKYNVKLITNDHSEHSIQTGLFSGKSDGIINALLRQTEYTAELFMSGFKPDIIHCFDWSTAWTGIILAEHFKCKLLYHVQLKLRESLVLKPEGYQELCIRNIEDIELTMLNKCDLILQVSKAYADLYPKIFKYKTLFLHNGINLEEWKERKSFELPGNRPIKGVYIGRYAYMKNVDTLINSNIPDNIDLIFAGSEEGGDKYLFEYIRGKIKEKDNLHYVGPVYGDRKVGLIQNADFVIMPSRHEPFGIVALEAMAAKTLLLCSMQDGLKEFVSEDFAINCGITVDSISESLQKVSNMTKEEMINMTNNAYKQAEELTWEKQAKKLLKIYHFLINN